MGKYRKAIFPDYRGFGEQSIRDRITDLLGEIPDAVEMEGPDTGLDIDSEKGMSPAKTQNLNQELVAAYLEGRVSFSRTVQQAYLEETVADNPNQALFRKYFREGNSRLQFLLVRILEEYPTDASLLNDLSVLHEAVGNLEELVTCYRRACLLETDPYAFASLAEAFYYNTLPDGYDAWHEMRRILSGSAEKMAIIEYLEDRHLPEKHPKEPIFQ